MVKTKTIAIHKRSLSEMCRLLTTYTNCRIFSPPSTTTPATSSYNTPTTSTTTPATSILVIIIILPISILLLSIFIHWKCCKTPHHLLNESSIEMQPIQHSPPIIRRTPRTPGRLPTLVWFCSFLLKSTLGSHRLGNRGKPPSDHPRISIYISV